MVNTKSEIPALEGGNLFFTEKEKEKKSDEEGSEGGGKRYTFSKSQERIESGMDSLEIFGLEA